MQKKRGYCAHPAGKITKIKLIQFPSSNLIVGNLTTIPFLSAGRNTENSLKTYTDSKEN